MSKVAWDGIFAVLVTPFHEDLSVDHEALDRQVDFCLDCGVQGLVAPVVASEFFTLSDAERVQIVGRVVERAKGRVPLVAGVAGTSAMHAAELTRAAASAGADALIAMPPYTARLPKKGVIAYYQSIAEASDLPVMVQNADAPIGSPLATEDLAALARALPAIEAVKEESAPNPQRVGALTAATGPRGPSVFGGLGGIYLFNELRRGARGSMPACQFADVAVDIFGLAASGKEAEARRRFGILQPALVMERLYGMTFMKECLVRRGVLRNTLTRVPEATMDADDQRELDVIWGELEPLFRVADVDRPATNGG